MVLCIAFGVIRSRWLESYFSDDCKRIYWCIETYIGGGIENEQKTNNIERKVNSSVYLLVTSTSPLSWISKWQRIFRDATKKSRDRRFYKDLRRCVVRDPVTFLPQIRHGSSNGASTRVLVWRTHRVFHAVVFWKCFDVSHKNMK